MLCSDFPRTSSIGHVPRARDRRAVLVASCSGGRGRRSFPARRVPPCSCTATETGASPYRSSASTRERLLRRRRACFGLLPAAFRTAAELRLLHLLRDAPAAGGRCRPRPHRASRASRHRCRAGTASVRRPPGNTLLSSCRRLHSVLQPSCARAKRRSPYLNLSTPRPGTFTSLTSTPILNERKKLDRRNL